MRLLNITGETDMSATYDEDLYTWSLEQATLLRTRQFDQIDLEQFTNPDFWPSA